MSNAIIVLSAMISAAATYLLLALLIFYPEVGRRVLVWVAHRLLKSFQDIARGIDDFFRFIHGCPRPRRTVPPSNEDRALAMARSLFLTAWRDELTDEVLENFERQVALIIAVAAAGHNPMALYWSSGPLSPFSRPDIEASWR